MSYTRTLSTNHIATKQSASQLLKTLNVSTTTTSYTNPTLIRLPRHSSHLSASRRQFGTTTPRSFTNSQSWQMKEFFPAPERHHTRTTEPAWPHPIYSAEQMADVQVAHRNAATWSDWVALTMVRVLRWGMDVATRYKHDDARALSKTDPEKAREKYGMTERKYMIRNIFLESIAGVPGAVGGILRHLHSLRRMKRDNGWIETLWEESFNERMHLLTFLKMAEPGPFMRLMVLGGQGVFFNAFFLAYLVSPRTCHRFVGYLEEEAIITYTRQIEDLDAGKLPQWENLAAPDIAVNYWKMPEGHRSMRDLLLYIRADESKHREVNHTLGNLNQKTDPNPYASQYLEPDKPHPSKDLAFQKPQGWERKDVI